MHSREFLFKSLRQPRHTGTGPGPSARGKMRWPCSVCSPGGSGRAVHRAHAVSVCTAAVHATRSAIRVHRPRLRCMVAYLAGLCHSGAMLIFKLDSEQPEIRMGVLWLLSHYYTGTLWVRAAWISQWFQSLSELGRWPGVPRQCQWVPATRRKAAANWQSGTVRDNASAQGSGIGGQLLDWPGQGRVPRWSLVHHNWSKL